MQNHDHSVEGDLANAGMFDLQIDKKKKQKTKIVFNE
jgi:hypothetical protein